MIRLHEVHPMLAHFPLVLVPLAFVTDLLGRITGNHRLMKFGRGTMPVAAATGIATLASGLAAQPAVNVGDAHDLLTTHRNLNAALVGLVGIMAVMRWRQNSPGTGYLLAGTAVMAGMGYTAYLGGKMVYDHGVGVAPDGVNEERSPPIRFSRLAETTQVAVANIRDAAKHVIKHIKRGDLAPALRQQ